MRAALVALVLLAGFGSASANGDTKICPIYPYGNFGGVTYYYAAKCVDGATTTYVSWAGPSGLTSNPCTTGCQPAFLLPAKTALTAAKPSKNNDADPTTRNDGAPNFNQPDYTEASPDITLKRVKLTQLITATNPQGEVLPFCVQVIKGNKAIRLQVHAWEIVPKNVAHPPKVVAVAYQRAEDPDPTDEVVEPFHVAKHMWHFNAPIPGTIFNLEAQAITHKTLAP